jgi:poly(3-hydroxybutyrate) depolymerase
MRPAAAILLLLWTAGLACADGNRVSIPLILDGKPDSTDASVTGHLFRPGGPGPFPAVVLMHGCDGLGWHTPRQGGWLLLQSYAQRLMRSTASSVCSREPKAVRRK